MNRRHRGWFKRRKRSRRIARQRERVARFTQWLLYERNDPALWGGSAARLHEHFKNAASRREGDWMKPWEETWEVRHSSQACGFLPRVVSGDEPVLYVAEDASGAHERGVLHLAAAAPELYRIVEAWLRGTSGDLDATLSMAEYGALKDAADVALRKARGEP